LMTRPGPSLWSMSAHPPRCTAQSFAETRADLSVG